MDPFVRRLIENLLAPNPSLSRNRHFPTFESALGKRALRAARRLASLRRSICELAAAHATDAIDLQRLPGGRVRLALAQRHLAARRVAILDEAELELLCAWPEVARALERRAG